MKSEQTNQPPIKEVLSQRYVLPTDEDVMNIPLKRMKDIMLEIREKANKAKDEDEKIKIIHDKVSTNIKNLRNFFKLYPNTPGHADLQNLLRKYENKLNELYKDTHLEIKNYITNLYIICNSFSAEVGDIMKVSSPEDKTLEKENRSPFYKRMWNTLCSFFKCFLPCFYITRVPQKNKAHDQETAKINRYKNLIVQKFSVFNPPPTTIHFESFPHPKNSPRTSTDLAIKDYAPRLLKGILNPALRSKDKLEGAPSADSDRPLYNPCQRSRLAYDSKKH